jgi:hypothetical protein
MFNKEIKCRSFSLKEKEKEDEVKCRFVILILNLT